MSFLNNFFHGFRSQLLTKRILHVRPDLQGDDFAICNYIHEEVISYGKQLEEYDKKLEQLRWGKQQTFPKKPEASALLLAALRFQAGKWLFGGKDMLDKRLVDNLARVQGETINRQEQVILEQKAYIDQVSPKFAVCLRELEDLRREVALSREQIVFMQIGMELENRMN